MAIDISQLLTLLNNAKGKYQTTDPQLYQVIKSLIQTLQLIQSNKGNSDLVQAIADIQKVINALELEGFLTWEDDSATLKNSRELLAGTNITFDDTVINQRTINATSSGGSSTTNSAVYIPTEREINNLLSIPPKDPLLRSMGFTITGGTSTPVTGAQNFANRPATGGVFTHWTAIGFPSGSAVVDIKKAAFSTGAFPSVSSICASDKPTLSSAQVAEGTCTGWTTGFNAGDLFQPNLDSVTTCTAIMVILWFLPR